MGELWQGGRFNSNSGNPTDFDGARERPVEQPRDPKTGKFKREPKPRPTAPSRP